MIRRIGRDRSGVTIVEFGLLSPVFGLLLIGAFDVGHTLYMRAVVQGAVQKAARDAALETGATAATRTTIDNRVREQIHNIAANADIVITRRSYRTFSQAAAARAESYTDTNNNRRCDNGEPFVDANRNGVRDLDGGSEGQGGAKDSVLYTVRATYPRMFPLHRILSLPDDVTISAATVLANQPYGDQGSDTPVVRQCPLT